jgi:hypothetical protein
VIEKCLISYASYLNEMRTLKNLLLAKCTLGYVGMCSVVFALLRREQLAKRQAVLLCCFYEEFKCLPKAGNLGRLHFRAHAATLYSDS